ncbi:MAG: hypothetical protein V3V01_09855 [Acidimicrobiales bacterium]
MQTSSNGLGTETDPPERSLLDRAFNGPDNGQEPTRATSWLESESVMAIPVVVDRDEPGLAPAEPPVGSSADQPAAAVRNRWPELAGAVALAALAVLGGFAFGRSGSTPADTRQTETGESEVATQTEPNAISSAITEDSALTAEFSVMFRANSVQLDAAAFSAVEAASAVVTERPSSRLLVVAGADPGVAGPLGQELARLRSLELREALVALGVDSSRIQIAVTAEAEPLGETTATATVLVVP